MARHHQQQRMKQAPAAPATDPQPKKIRPAEEKKVTGEDLARKAQLEREIRHYIKRTGGFRHNLHAGDKKEAQDLIDRWNETYRPTQPRKIADGWDQIHVKGYDNVDHFQNQRHIKPRYADVG